MPTPTKDMTDEQLKTTILEFLGAMNDHDIDRAMDHFSKDVIWSDPSLVEPLKGEDVVREHLREMWTAFPDLRFPLDDLEIMRGIDHNHALAYWSGSLTMKGPWMGFAPTDRHAQVKGVCHYTFKGSKIWRHTIIFDQMELAGKLGLLPRMGTGTFKWYAGMQRLAEPVIELVRR